jgi:hypothetical protein
MVRIRIQDRNRSRNRDLSKVGTGTIKNSYGSTVYFSIVADSKICSI